MPYSCILLLLNQVKVVCFFMCWEFKFGCFHKQDKIIHLATTFQLKKIYKYGQKKSIKKIIKGNTYISFIRSNDKISCARAYAEGEYGSTKFYKFDIIGDATGSFSCHKVNHIFPYQKEMHWQYLVLFNLKEITFENFRSDLTGKMFSKIKSLI